MEIFDIVGKVIDLCKMEGEENESVKKLKLTLVTLQRHLYRMEEVKISDNLQKELKDDLLEAEQLLKAVIK